MFYSLWNAFSVDGRTSVGLGTVWMQRQHKHWMQSNTRSLTSEVQTHSPPIFLCGAPQAVTACHYSFLLCKGEAFRC